MILIENSVWINPSPDWSKSNFQTESIWMNPRSEWFGLILIENSVWSNPSPDWFELIWIENLVSDWLIDWCLGIGSFWSRCYLDWIGFKSWYRIIQFNTPDWNGMNGIKSDWFLTVFHKTRYKKFLWLVGNDS